MTSDIARDHLPWRAPTTRWELVKFSLRIYENYVQRENEKLKDKCFNYKVELKKINYATFHVSKHDN